MAFGRGEGEGGGGGRENMRDLGKSRRHGLVDKKTDSKSVLLFEMIKLIFC